MPSPSSIDRELTQLLELGDRVVQMACARGGPGTVAECVLRSGAEMSAKVRKGEPELVEEAGTCAAGLRVIRDRKVSSTSTSDLTDAGIERFVSDAIELSELSQGDPFAGPADPHLLCNPSDAPDVDIFDPAGGSVDALQAIALATQSESAAFAYDPRITQSEGSTFGRVAGGVAMVLSSGFRAAYKGSYQSLSVVPVVADVGGKNRRGHYFTARRHLAELESPEEVGRQAARRAVAKLGARTIGTCEVPVVFDPDAARSIVGMMASCVLGSAIWRKSSYLLGREGTRVASELVTIVDDPLLLRAPGSRSFDGEGLVSRRNVVVERGELRMFLCDSYSARKLGRESTASAGRGGGAGVGATTSNFILQGGSDSNEAIVRSTPRGLYVTEMMGFGFNPVTGDFSRGASGFWIEGGELAYPVSEVTISLNVDELWQRVDAVGSDLDLRTSTASPTLRVSKMTVAGGSSNA